LHPAFFSYAVTVVSSNEILICRSKLSDSKAHQISPTALDNWLKANQSVFNIPFKNIKVAVNALSFQLINDATLATPKSFSLLNDYSDLTHQLQVDEIDSGLYIQYAINKKISKILNGHFNKNAICFGDIGILKAASAGNEKGSFVLAQILENELTLAAHKDNQLVFFNKFSIQSADDVLYYILSVYQNAALEPNEDFLYLTGLIEPNSALFDMLFNYVRNVEFTAGFEPKKLNEPLATAHYYFNLFNIV
jgi:hypothetical protein